MHRNRSRSYKKKKKKNANQSQMTQLKCFSWHPKKQVGQINELQEHINSMPTPVPLMRRKKTLTPRYFIYRNVIMSYIPENDIRAQARHLRKAR